jgi:hypothetical protein
MTYVGQVLAIGEARGYAQYNSLSDSMEDLFKWYAKRRTLLSLLINPISNLDQYVSFLKNNDYFEADEAVYLKGCKHFFNKIFIQNEA